MKRFRSTVVAIMAGLAGVTAFQAEGQVFINEVCADNKGAIRNLDNTPDYVELFNAGSQSVNLGGWLMTDNTNSIFKFIFPANTIIQPRGFLIVWCDGNTNDPGVHTGFSLSATTDDVALYEGPPWSPVLRDYILYGLQVADMPISRIPDGSPTWRLSQATPGSENQAVPVLGTPMALKINEWMATNSAGPTRDWLELYNPSTNPPVNLEGLVLSDISGPAGKRPLPTLSFVSSNGFVRLWANDKLGPFPIAEADELNFKLSSTSGDVISLYTPGATVLIDQVFFGPQSRDVSMGRLPDGNDTDSHATDYKYFPPGKSTPGESNFLPITNAVFNEILAHTDPPLEDAIELYNPTAQPYDISNFWLSNSEFNPKKYRIPAGTVIPAFGYKVFYEIDFNPDRTGNAPSFTLNSARGDEVALFSADAAGNLTGFRLYKSFGATENGVSLGEYIKSDGGTDLMPMSKLSFGTPIKAGDPQEWLPAFRLGVGTNNPYPLVGPLVISEIMYHPPDLIQGTNVLDNDWDEYIEVSNIAATNTPLFNFVEPTNRWKISRGVDYEFPSGVVLPVGGSLLVVNFDPLTNATQLGAFRTNYNLSTNVPIYGPYKGKLANSVMSLELTKPDWVQGPGRPDAGLVPEIMVEKIKYEDDTPWPTNGVDGGGYSLHRRSLPGYANDHTNWFGAAPSPGVWDSAPTIITPPQDQNGASGGTVTFSVAAGGTRPLSYQWQFNGTNLNGQTLSNLTLVNIGGANAGGYRAIVANPLGVVTSSVATLSLAAVPTITAPPQSQDALAGSDVNFDVTATGTGLLSYQWQFNAQNLAGQTARILTLTNVQTNHAGNYRVIVTDTQGSATSPSAALTVAGSPHIAPPQTNPDGTLTFSFGAVPGFTYTVDGSDDLTNWTFVAAYTNVNGTVQYTDPGTNTYRFFRARVTQ